MYVICYFPYCASLNFTVLVLFQGGRLEGDPLITVVKMTGTLNMRIRFSLSHSLLLGTPASG